MRLGGKNHFFFVNKKEAKKTLLTWTALLEQPVAQFSKSFLVTCVPMTGGEAGRLNRAA
jgi:hypothetical protein